MLPNASALIPRIGGVAAVLVLLAAALSQVASYYTEALVALGSPLMWGSFVVEANGAHELTVGYAGDTLLADPNALRWVTLNTLILGAGPVLLAALILMTPRLPPYQRLTGALGAVAGFLVVHVLSMVVVAWVLKWTMYRGDLSLDAVTASGTFFSFLVPAFAAGLWCLRFWLPAYRDTSGVRSIR